MPICLSRGTMRVRQSERRHRNYRWALTVVLLLVASACTSSSDPTVPSTDSTTGVDSTSASPPTSTSAGTVPDDATGAAQAWIAESAGLSADVQASLHFDGVERAGNVSHVRFVQSFDGVPVEDAELIVHVLGDGTVQGATSSLSDATPAGDATLNTDAAGAIAIAAKAVTGTVHGTPETTSVWVEDGTALRLTWRVDLGTVDPLGSWTVHVDADTGGVIRADRTESRRNAVAPGLVTGQAGISRAKALLQSSDRCALPAAPSACIFRPDPIYGAGGTLDDPSRANDFLVGVALQGLNDPSSGALIGEFANAAPPGAPVAPTSQPDGMWGAGRGDAGFEAQNAYYWIDYGQRTVQRLGFDSILNQSFPVVPIDPDTVDNAFYSPGEGKVYLGVGSNGIHEGEDATGILHEYGHALLDAVNPNLLGTGDIGAYHEAFGDIFAALVTLEFRTGDWPCFFIWTDQSCLRRMDTSKTYPQDLQQQSHSDGEIYSGAVADILRALLAETGINIDDCPGSDQCNAARDRVLTTVLASNYYLAANSSMPDIASGYLLANEAQFGGADAQLISDAFAARGLVGGSGATIDSGGETIGSVADVAVEIDIGHSYRGDLRVTVGVIDADFNHLCTAIEVFEPDSADSAENLSGTLDLSDTDCAPLAPPSPDHIWFLSVEDTLADDEGEILGFSVIASGTAYLASGLPLPIADADPDGSTVFVHGTGQGVQQEGTEDIGSTGAGVTSMSVALDHTYRGDLQVRAGVADAEGNITCSVPILEPDASDDTSGPIEGDVDMSECAALFPPTPDQQWFLQVIDTAELDVGTINGFSVTGADGSSFEFTDLPVQVPDNNVDGVALLLDGSGGSSGQAGGGGQGADLGLPSASIAITHPYAGDLAVAGGVLDASGNVLCEVSMHTPDANNSDADLAGDVSLAECEQFYPPSPSQQWYLFVADTLSADVGAVDAFALTGPDGAVYTYSGLPVPLPDADPNGVRLVLDGSELGLGTTAEPVANIVISHPYVGDLRVFVGVADEAGNVLCSVTVAEADVSNNGIDLAQDVAMGDCASFYPPGPDQRWFVGIVDNFDFDEGTVEAFALFGPDGAVWQHPDAPLTIPDNDPGGVFLTFDGSQTPLGGSPGADPVVRLNIVHSFAGDLRIRAGVAGADGTILCEVNLAEPDSGNSSADFTSEAPLRECAAFFPPTPDNRWFIFVADEAAQDIGTVEFFEVRGGDGQSFVSTGTPLAIPDDDPDGVFLIIPE